MPPNESHRCLRLARWLVACSILAAPLRATGQSDAALATRRMLIEQAQQASDAGDHQRAAELARHAIAVQSTASARLFLAEQLLQTGDFASALGSADACMREGERDANSPQRPVVLGRCREILASLHSRVGFVTVRVPQSAPPELAVTVGGVAIAPALFGVPNVVTPGTVIVEATAARYALFRRAVVVGPGESLDVDIGLVALAASSVAPNAPPATGARLSDTRSEWRTAPLVIGAAGIVGLISAGVFLGVRQDAIQGCSGQSDGSLACPPGTDIARAELTPTWEGLSIGTAIVGATLIAGAVVWWLVARPHGAHAQARGIPEAERGRGGAVMEF